MTVALLVKRAYSFSNWELGFARCLIRHHSKFLWKLTKALFVSRSTVCASPLSVAATGTAPVPRHIEIMFSIEPCHSCGVVGNLCRLYEVCLHTRYDFDRLTVQMSLPAIHGSLSAGRASTTRTQWPGPIGWFSLPFRDR